MAKLVVKSKSLVEDDYLPRVHRIAAAASDLKAVDIRAYDVVGLTLIADAFVVCSAHSEPQMKAIANAVRGAMGSIGISPLSTEGDVQSGWMVLDYGTVIVHIFRDQAREFYDLDGLWADAPRIAVDVDG